MQKVNIYKTRMSPNITEEERQILVFEELENLEKEVERQSKKTSFWSSVFGIINTILNLVMILSSAVIVTVTSVYDGLKIVVIVLGGVILAISSCNQLLKLGPRGFHYRQGTIRLRRIRGQIRDIKYMFHTFTTEQVLAFLSSFRTETDEIDLDLYKTSMTESRYIDKPEHIIVNMDNSQNSRSNSLNNSPVLSRNSPVLNRNSPVLNRNSPYSSPVLNRNSEFPENESPNQSRISLSQINEIS